jgi:hypothetical protein
MTEFARDRGKTRYTGWLQGTLISADRAHPTDKVLAAQICNRYLQYAHDQKDLVRRSCNNAKIFLIVTV